MLTETQKDRIIERIKSHTGQTFKQLEQQEFTITDHGSHLRVSTTTAKVGYTTLRKAIDLMPAGTVRELRDQGVWAPSYVYGILMDDRIRGDLY